MFYAHTRDDGSRQTVEEHLRGTMKKRGNMVNCPAYWTDKSVFLNRELVSGENTLKDKERSDTYEQKAISSFNGDCR